MKFTIAQIFITVSVLVCIDSCKSKTLIGNWKIDQVTFIDGYGHEDPVNINDKDSLTITLHKTFTNRFTEKQIDSLAHFIQNSFLTLKNDSTYKLVDPGSLIRDSFDILFTKGRIEGNWTFNSEKRTINLKISPTLSQYYKVVDVTDTTLLINELYKETNSPVSRVKLIRQ